jgi:hypothetical protein
MRFTNKKLKFTFTINLHLIYTRMLYIYSTTSFIYSKYCNPECFTRTAEMRSADIAEDQPSADPLRTQPEMRAEGPSGEREGGKFGD